MTANVAKPRLSSRAATVATLLLGSCLLTCPEQRRVEAWLYCDECIAGEREAVRRLGLRAVPTLVAALDAPTGDREAFVRRSFQLRYASLPPTERTRLVDDGMASFTAMVQKRAAVSLGDIGGNKARAALTTALSNTGLRSDVLEAIRVILGSMDATPFSGTIAPLMAGFGDTVTVTASAGGPLFDGNELASLDGAHFPPDTVLVSRDQQTLGFVVTAEAGQRAISLTNVGSGSNTEFVSLFVNTTVDGNDRQMMSCSTLACQRDSAPQVALASLPYQGFLSLWRTGPRVDTLDLFRLENPGRVPAVAVTARADWTGQSPLDLSWLNCSDLVPVPAPPGPSTTTSRESSVSIPGGTCRLLLLGLPSGGTRSFVRIRLRTP